MQKQKEKLNISKSKLKVKAQSAASKIKDLYCFNGENLDTLIDQVWDAAQGSNCNDIKETFKNQSEIGVNHLFMELDRLKDCPSH